MTVKVVIQRILYLIVIFAYQCILNNNKNGFIILTVKQKYVFTQRKFVQNIVKSYRKKRKF